MHQDTFLLIAMGFYALSVSGLYLSIQGHSRAWRLASIALCIAGVLAHGIAQSGHWLRLDALDASLLNVLSLCALTTVLLLCGSVLSRNPLYDASLVALPMTMAVLALEWMLPARSLIPGNPSSGTTLHILSSVMAFGVFSIAGVYALFVAVIDHFLRHHHLNPFVRALPPLETLERLLFQLITIGFVLLTASLVSGLVFVDDLFSQHLAHKTVLSLMAWMIFGLLLWGRWRYGWRGRNAVRLTLAGIVLLVLAYFGSKFVLESILGRNWRSG